MEKIRIVCISDTHTKHRQVKVPDGDILIHAGDIMNSGHYANEITDFLGWFNNHPHEVKIFIAGNHDRYFEDYPRTSNEILKAYPGIIYLENSGVEIGGIRIWGTPVSRIFYNWAFNRSPEDMREEFAKIPEDTQILISHAPALGILDKLDNKNLGERELLNRIENGLPELKLHVHGHIHSGYGLESIVTRNDKNYQAVNASQCNESYQIVNKPIIIDGLT